MSPLRGSRYNDAVGPDDKICYCYNVPFRKLWSFACRSRLRRASQLSECLGAGTGCGWCIPVLKRIFERSQQADEAGSPDGAGTDREIPDITAQEYAEKRQEYIRTKKPRNQF